MNRRQVSQRIVWASLVAVGLAAGLGGTGCNPYDEGGSQASYDVAPFVSTSHQPKTVSIVDTRDGSIVWTWEIPVGKKLVIDFDQDKFKDNPNRPDVMRWQEMDADQRYGSLNNEMAVPRTRRIDWFLREPGEAAPGAKPKAASAGER
jgi:hypothetical protein